MNKQRGSIAVETALGLPILIMAILTWLDICVFTYSTALTDHALTVGVMKIKKQGSSYGSTKVDYESLLATELNNSGGALWNAITKQGSVQSSIEYLSGYQELVNCSMLPADERETCASGEQDSSNKPVAIYKLKYEYQPMFNFLMPNMEIRREIISIQENERCSFQMGVGGGCDE
ncbi:TadE/TadG family type IV pilus assembly protein [Vibrio hepatarius]|uniref:TadE/TadG family type IV pilus assembly protein n=1 Tax=Vibrio hepatarius TaxID=171383 RepID=UPI00142D3F42|nr:TadE family protein [Vibrio hepatarius]NIY84158.1 pilus assembly protein [Vibrio hepatarius]